MLSEKTVFMAFSRHYYRIFWFACNFEWEGAKGLAPAGSKLPYLSLAALGKM